MKFIETDFDKTYDELNKLYEADSNYISAKFNSPIFNETLKKINAILHNYNYSVDNNKNIELNYEIGIHKEADKFNGFWWVNINFENKQDTDNALAELKAIKELRYCNLNKNRPNSVYIGFVAADLSDNTWTADDLIKYVQGDPETVERLDALALRLGRRDDDERLDGKDTDPEAIKNRWFDFYDALVYEDALNGREDLIGINNLKLAHSNKKFSNAPDKFSDFTGNIDHTINYEYNGNINNKAEKYSNDIKYTYTISAELKANNCAIEGKGVKGFGSIKYDETEQDSRSFAALFRSWLRNNSLGSLHNASYVLIVNKSNGIVVCVTIKNPDLNWYAGKVDVKFAPRAD